MRVLDLGCGDNKVDGAIGLDRVAVLGVDAVADLSDPRFPFADHSFDTIYLNDVIEHLPDTLATMESIHRIAKPGAKIFIRVVNWNSHYTAMDPTHLKAFTENSFDFFGKHQRSYYTHARFNVAKCDLQFNAQAEKFFFGRRKLLHFLSRYLCNILEGLNFELHAVKREISPGDIPRDDETLFNLLRCPHCASLRIRPRGSETGRLHSVSSLWLACEEPGCGRKYPILDGVPIMLPREAEQWAGVQVKQLPTQFPKELLSVRPLPPDQMLPS